jgi:hypothetical protein
MLDYIFWKLVPGPTIKIYCENYNKKFKIDQWLKANVGANLYDYAYRKSKKDKILEIKFRKGKSNYSLLATKSLTKK